jgi:uncharacterized membrane protein YphA (DoxX/SURF4 family)
MFQIALSLKEKSVMTEHLTLSKYPTPSLVPWAFQIVLFGASLFIAIGLFTQITSLVSIYVLLSIGNINKYTKQFPHSESTFFFVSLICFGLLFLGAGGFAFDLPL